MPGGGTGGGRRLHQGRPLALRQCRIVLRSHSGLVCGLSELRGRCQGSHQGRCRSKDPVVFLEHKGLYRRPQAKTLEPDADYTLPFGRGAIRREGTDLTVVAWGSTVYLALDLARQIEKEGVSIQVIDLRCIVPLDEELIYRSVRKTNRVVIAHEDTLMAGFGAEVVARIAENCIGSLDGPVVRVTAKDSFVPSAPNLELAVLPSLADLRRGAEKALAF